MKLNRLFMVAAVFTVVICMTITGCSSKEPDKENNGKIKVVTTIFAAYDFARQTGGDLTEVSMLLKPGAEAHSYEPTPKDIVDIGNCDVFVCNGGENEVWVETILETIENSDMIVVRMVDCCEGIEEENVQGMQEGGILSELFIKDEEEETEWDEHVWMSPENAKLISEKICEAYCTVDSENKDKYNAYLDEYTEKLDRLNGDILNGVRDLDSKLLVFADRFPARYFVEEYGLEYRAAFSGCSANTQASAATVAYIIDLVKSQNVSAVFTMELSDGRLADAVSEETGAEVKTFYTGHNVALDDFKSGITYIDLMYRNLEAIVHK